MVLRFSRAKQGQGNVEKSVLHVQSCFFFLLIRKKRALHVQNLFLAY